MAEITLECLYCSNGCSVCEYKGFIKYNDGGTKEWLEKRKIQNQSTLRLKVRRIPVLSALSVRIWAFGTKNVLHLLHYARSVTEKAISRMEQIK